MKFNECIVVHFISLQFVRTDLNSAFWFGGCNCTQEMSMVSENIIEVAQRFGG